MAKTKGKKAVKIALITIACVLALTVLGFGSFLAYALNFNKDPKVTFDISSKPYAEDFSVMNFNVRCISPEDTLDRSWFERAPRIITQIAMNDPDIICFQEVGRIQAGYLENALKGYGVINFFRQKHIFAESMSIYFNESRFQLERSGGFWLSPTPEKMSKGWNAANYRVASYAVLKDVRSGKRFAVFCTHLDHKSEQARINGIDLVLRKIDELRAELNEEGSLPAMLLGDMNDYIDSPTYLKAVENFDNSRLVAKTPVEDSRTYQGFGLKETVNSAIDYCFLLKDSFDVEEYKVVDELVGGKYASDHFAIRVTLSIK